MFLSVNSAAYIWDCSITQQQINSQQQEYIKVAVDSLTQET